MSLRHRLEHSNLLARALARVVGSYLRLCQWTTRWDVIGAEGLTRTLADGPILLVMWHERSLMGPVHWPVAAGQLSSLHAASPIGRVSGAMQRQFGLQPMEMSRDASNRAASRQILRRARAGVSIGLTGDGPLGPAREMQDAPLDWARALQQPVFGYAFATRHHRRLGTWDHMILPLPFGRGRVVFRRWDAAPDRKDTNDTWRQDLADFLDDVTAAADRPF